MTGKKHLLAFMRAFVLAMQSALVAHWIASGYTASIVLGLLIVAIWLGIITVGGTYT